MKPRDDDYVARASISNKAKRTSCVEKARTMDDDATNNLYPSMQPQTIRVPLVRELIASSQQKPMKMSTEAAEATSELLRLFVVEARNRAAIEAECELESQGPSTSATIEADKTKKSDDRAIIGAHHITKLAAELLMEFS